MSNLKLTDSIFDTSFNGNSDWNFNITKDTTVTNNNSNIGDMSKNTTLNQTEIGGNSLLNNGTNLLKYYNTAETKGNAEGSKNTSTDDSMFSSGNIGSTLKGGGAIIGALSGIYGTLEQTKFNKEALGMEKDRINRNTAREDKLQKNYEGIWS